jgi:hypothetical protein
VQLSPFPIRLADVEFEKSNAMFAISVSSAACFEEYPYVSNIKNQN